MKGYAEERGDHFLPGTPEELLKEMDRSALVRLKLETAGGTRNEASVEFTAKSGAAAWVTGELAWANGTVSSLATELKRARPPWWFLRTKWFSVAVALTAWGPIAVPVLIASEPEDWVGFGFTLIALGWLLQALIEGGIRWVLPGFEIVGAGDRGKGARVLGIAMSALALIFGPYMDRLVG